VEKAAKSHGKSNEKSNEKRGGFDLDEIQNELIHEIT